MSNKVSSYQAHFARFLPDAQALPAADVLTYRADARVALANARRGLANLEVSPADLRKHLPHAPVDDILSVADVARGTVFATTRVGVRAASDGEIAAKLAIVSPLREDMLATAEVLARRGVFDPKVVAGLRAGAGRFDIAEDGVGLVGLYTANAAKAAGLHPFTKADFDTLRAASEWLLERLTPTGAKREPTEQNHEPADTRDRMWTLLVRRHDWLRRAAHYFYGDAFEERVPKLQSRVVAASDEEEADGESDGESGSGPAGTGTPPQG
jgi:hypothetical protein